MVFSILHGHSSVGAAAFFSAFFCVFLPFSSTNKCPNGQAVKIETLHAQHSAAYGTVKIYWGDHPARR